MAKTPKRKPPSKRGPTPTERIESLLREAVASARESGEASGFLKAIGIRHAPAALAEMPEAERPAQPAPTEAPKAPDPALAALNEQLKDLSRTQQESVQKIEQALSAAARQTSDALKDGWESVQRIVAEQSAASTKRDGEFGSALKAVAEGLKSFGEDLRGIKASVVPPSVPPPPANDNRGRWGARALKTIAAAIVLLAVIAGSLTFYQGYVKPTLLQQTAENRPVPPAPVAPQAQPNDAVKERYPKTEPQAPVPVQGSGDEKKREQRQIADLGQERLNELTLRCPGTQSPYLQQEPAAARDKLAELSEQEFNALTCTSIASQEEREGQDRPARDRAAAGVRGFEQLPPPTAQQLRVLKARAQQVFGAPSPLAREYAAREMKGEPGPGCRPIRTQRDSATGYAFQRWECPPGTVDRLKW